MMRGWPGFEAPENSWIMPSASCPATYDLFGRLSSGDQYPQAEARQEDMFGWRRSELASALS